MFLCVRIFAEMKAKTVFILGGVAALAFLLYSKVTSLANAAKSLVIQPRWDGSLDDMNVSLDGITLPLAVDLYNRSDQTMKVRLNALDVYVKDTLLAYSKPGMTEVLLLPQQSTALRGIRIKVTYLALVMAFGDNIKKYLTQTKEERKGMWTEKLAKTKFRIDLTINDSIQVPVEVNINGEVGVGGLDGGYHRNGTSQDDEDEANAVPAQNRIVYPYGEWEQFFPPWSHLLFRDEIVIDDVQPEQTCKYMRHVARKWKADTTRLARRLAGGDVETTVQNVWDFVALHIQYVPDSRIREQVRRPLRILFDKKGDCDCYATFIASVFENLGIPYKLRMVEFDGKGFFQHVYVVAVVNGVEMVCDPVVHKCFYEKRYTNKKDY